MNQLAMKAIFFISVLSVLLLCLPGVCAAGDFAVDDTVPRQNAPGFSSCEFANGTLNPYCPLWDGEHTQPDPYLVYELRRKIVAAVRETQGGSPSPDDYGILSLPPPQNEFPTTGTVRVPVFLVDFSDAPHDASQTVEEVQSKMFGNGNGGYPYESLRNYYQRSSYNQLTITGDVYGWYRAAQPRSYYMNLGKTDGKKALINEVLLAYNSQINFANYDANGNGKIDALFIKWAGPDTGWGSFWWASMSGVSSPVTVDGVTPRYFVWSWYSNPEGGAYNPHVDMHESGHILGLPDYYDYNSSVGPKGGLGGWDMMDYNWGDHNAFSKYLLGWIDPVVISSGTHQILLPPSGTTSSDNTVLIMPNAVPDSFGEFFLVQYREPGTGNDPLHTGLTKAVWIWHVDSTLSGGGDYLYDNSYTGHKLLRLMEADGQEQIETGDGYWDVYDFYLPGKVLGPATLPGSTTYAGSITNVSVANIQQCGSSMQVDFSILSDAPVAGFSANVTSGTVPLTVKFTDSSAGTGLSDWKWDFENDGSVDSTSRSPTYTYTTAGTYTVNLTVNGTAGTDSESKAGYISVSVPAAPCAAFTVNTTSGTAPLTVKFTDTSANTPTAWNWSFTNVTPGNNTPLWFSTVQSPTHTFGAGNYSIVLNASNALGYNLSPQGTFINVTAAPVVINVTSQIGIFRPNSGIWSLDSNGNYAWEVSDKSLSWGLPGDIQVIGDWNGDGNDDIGIFRPGSGIWSLDSNGNRAWEGSDRSLSWGLPGDIPVVGDWNGDKKDDIGIFRPSSGIWSLDSNGNYAWEVSDKSLSWGLPNDVPIVGDWNGDGKDDIGIFRPGSGIWSLDSNGNFAWEGSDKSVSWGLPNDKPVIGDWNGDRKDKIGIFRPGSGIWSLDSNGNFAWEGSDKSVSWGLPNDKPVIGDWNGDGKDKIGIFRPGSGMWSLDSNGNYAWEGSDKSVTWGQPYDVPVVGNWNGG